MSLLPFLLSSLAVPAHACSFTPKVEPVGPVAEGTGFWTEQSGAGVDELVLEVDGVPVPVHQVRYLDSWASSLALWEPEVALVEGQSWRMWPSWDPEQVSEGIVEPPLPVVDPPEILGAALGEVQEGSDCEPGGTWRRVSLTVRGDRGGLSLGDRGATWVEGTSYASYVREGRSAAPACVVPVWIDADGDEVVLDEVCTDRAGCATVDRPAAVAVLELIVRR